MVAIKIQRAEDIVKAYLQSLNYEEKEAEKAAKNLLENINKKFKPEDDIIKIVDTFLLKKAKKIIKNKKMTDEQILAYFKTKFIMENGAEKCDFKGNFSETLTSLMNNSGLEIVPEYHLSQMLPQKIEPSSPKKMIAQAVKKLFHKKS
ncbi:MAG: hypothetical protein PHE89_04710 [Alphaproteobacteria bacterium]|nr:hypothetical protein [Alphaproteobacteria bacterium]